MPDLKTTNTTDFEAESTKLRRHFKFTKDDLEENQRGFLSDKQKKRIAGYERGGKTVGLIIGVALLAGAGAFIPLEVSMIKALTNDQVENGFSVFRIMSGGMAFILGLLQLLMAAAGIFLMVSQFIKRKQSKLLSIRGRASLVRGTSNRFTHVYFDLYINDQEFDGDSSMLNAIIQGAEYVVYYLEGTEEIMSAELIAAAE